MARFFKIPLVLEPASEGGWIVRSPIIPELITEIDDIVDLEETVKDAVEAAKELYEDLGKRFPAEEIEGPDRPVWFETLVHAR
ncbi:MAG: type II toxin-antitoxin system HicB family antitoxin [Candidatus Aminicenantes bacterium]|nr:type II toxin-antitoxin system HicB family antitoxin [Candidatus Aminicenantes bacterium]